MFQWLLNAIPKSSIIVLFGFFFDNLRLNQQSRKIRVTTETNGSMELCWSGAKQMLSGLSYHMVIAVKRRQINKHE